MSMLQLQAALAVLLAIVGLAYVVTSLAFKLQSYVEVKRREEVAKRAVVAINDTSSDLSLADQLRRSLATDRREFTRRNGSNKASPWIGLAPNQRTIGERIAKSRNLNLLRLALGVLKEVIGIYVCYKTLIQYTGRGPNHAANR